MKKKVWSHKKYGKRKYAGQYSRTANGERIFELSAAVKFGTGTRPHNISFESSSAAKKQGWVGV